MASVKEESNNTNKELEKEKKTRSEKELEKIKNPDAQKKKKNKKIIIAVIILITIMILACFFSVIFAITQKGRNTIVKGISAKGVELSNLTISDAKAKLAEQINKEIATPIKLKYEDYTLDLNLSEIEFKYNLDEIAEEAYKVGRAENILESNYSILLTMLNGKELEPKYTLNEEALTKIIENVDSNLPGKVVEYSHYIEEKELVVTPGKDGKKVNTEKLKETIIQAILNRNSQIQNKDYEEIEIPVYDKAADKIDMQKIHDEVYCLPKDAYLIKEPFELVKDVSGVDFSVSVQEAQNLITGDKEEYIIPLKITPANKTVADLGDEAFPHVLSDYKTNYNAGDRDRSTNLRLAANKINGLVLMPGEEFSFNKVVGKRTIQDGYKNAPIYQNGKVVDGLAGGICQISSTLYNAVLLANLEIVERRNHNFTSTYVPAGRDATVVYGAIDFKFKNTREYPIKLLASVSGGIASFQIKGIKQEVEYDVRIQTQVTQTIPFSEEQIEDSNIAQGTKQVVQGGHNGSKVNSYRVLFLNGNEVSRELLANDTYRVMNRIVKIPVITPTVAEPEQTPAVPEQPATPTPEVSQPESTPSTENNANAVPNTNTAPSTNTQTPAVTPSEKPQEQPKPQEPEVKPETKPEVKPEPKPEPKPEVKPGANENKESQNKANTNVNTNAAKNENINTGASTNTNTNANTNTKLNTTQTTNQ